MVNSLLTLPFLSFLLPYILPLSLSHTHTSHTVLPWALESWAEYDIRVYAKEGDLGKYGNTEHALCVLNHHGDLDWMIGWVLIERMGMLGVSACWLECCVISEHFQTTVLLKAMASMPVTQQTNCTHAMYT